MANFTTDMLIYEINKKQILDFFVFKFVSGMKGFITIYMKMYNNV